MVTRYRLLLLIAAGFFLIPCRYNHRNESFEICRWNLAAFPLTILVFGACIWLNVTAVSASVNLLPAVYLAALIIVLAVGSLLMISASLNTFYHRATFVRLLNTLLAQEETTLECLAMRRNGGKQISVAHHGNLWILIVTAILYLFYTLTFVLPDMIMFLMNGAIWLKYCGMFLLVEVFRACLLTIDVRMKQLKSLVMSAAPGTNVPEQQIEATVLIFLEKYQLYYEQIDLINRCFSVPVLLIILLILMDRTVAVYDLYINLERLTHMTATEVCDLSWRQMLEMIYLGLLLQISITCETTTAQVNVHIQLYKPLSTLSKEGNKKYIFIGLIINRLIAGKLNRWKIVSQNCLFVYNRPTRGGIHVCPLLGKNIDGLTLSTTTHVDHHLLI